MSPLAQKMEHYAKILQTKKHKQTTQSIALPQQTFGSLASAEVNTAVRQTAPQCSGRKEEGLEGLSLLRVHCHTPSFQPISATVGWAQCWPKPPSLLILPTAASANAAHSQGHDPLRR